MKKRSKKKMLSALLTMAIMAVSLGGCGSTTVDADNVVESTETMVENSTESTAETSNGTTTETGGKDDAVAGSDKPAEPTVSPSAEPSSTEKPEPTAEPTASPKPTATPEPTEPPHTHDYSESVTKQPTCTEDGVKTLTCVCGDVKTEAIPATGNHNWTEITTLVHHDSIGHTESIEEQVQVGTSETRHEYECSNCGATFDTPSAVVEHCKATGDFDHAFARTIIHDYPGEPIYETQTKTIWVVDQEAYDSEEVVGYKCSVCGATK